MRLETRCTPRAFILAATLLTAAAIPVATKAQNLDAFIQQSLNELNRSNAAIDQRVNGLVEQQMQNPQVQASYRQYLAQRQAYGQPAMDFRTYAYRYTYTAGFTPEGVARANAVDRANQAKISAAQNGLRDAQRAHAAALRERSESYSRIQNERGHALMGQSTYRAGNGASVVLPHTWQANSTYQHGGNTYHVDASGQYHARGSDGWWYPLSR